MVVTAHHMYLVEVLLDTLDYVKDVFDRIVLAELAGA